LAWRKNFIQTFLERDIPQLGIGTPAPTLLRFWAMLAHYHGQVWKRRFKSVPPSGLRGWHRHQEEKGSAPGAFFEKKGRPSGVLMDDFLAGSTGRMKDGRKKRKGFHQFRLERAI
jgi:hypothetical protein